MKFLYFNDYFSPQFWERKGTLNFRKTTFFLKKFQEPFGPNHPPGI
jgi:hypothetical protein